ncbi:MAG TPA: FtsW/RodA/SpoVE family cell cycle protein, partial [Streptosporangiaceae bacterium]|nr:FtsW/RodA/SpoVE family cell cycle protein [Streptosporangiaceae bacterium]
MSWVSSQSRSQGNPAWAAFRRLAARAASRDSALRHADWLLLAVVLALTLLGTLLIWSATQPTLIGQGSNPDEFLPKQVLNIAIGLVLMLIVSCMSTWQIRLYAPIVYGMSCLGLLAVLTPLGSIVNGARAWIAIGAGFQIEPSEFAKLSVIVISAMLLSGLRSGERPGARAIARTLGLAALPILLVAAEPDLGVMIVLVVIVGGLIALSGVRLWWMVGMIAATAVVVAAVAKLHLLKAYQVGRLTS